MSTKKPYSDDPTYKEITETPKPTKMWLPFLDNGRRSTAELIVANAAAWFGLLLIAAMCVMIYCLALFCLNGARDYISELLPGCANAAAVVSIALKVLVTVAVAFLMKFLWDCTPYFLSKLREEEDDIF
ncbi:MULTISPECIES: hypothetical protein [unclassified Paraburkholderia]|uniref:hypothetical protein n=1 Tax=unclassified Paraburkholderia TaxID=2615204 RepID=UPI002AB2125F|nr:MULTISPECIES: hypothetical protein [unclassified Paraburkholderia]